MFFVLAIFFHFAITPNLGNQIHAGLPQRSYNRCPGPVHAFPPDIQQPPRPHQPVSAPNFVPFKILYLIDPAISQENKAILERATNKVVDKLSKFLQAPALDDVRYLQLCEANQQACKLACQGVVPIPDEYIQDPPQCGSTQCQGPQTPITPKVAQQNKDHYTVVIGVSVVGDGTPSPKPYPCQPGAIAFGGGCLVNPIDRRPTHGYMVWCEQPKTKPDREIFDTALHETFHVLLSSLIGDSDPLLCQGGFTQCKANIMSEVEYDFIDANGARGPRKKKFLSILPLVRDAARDHFGCPTVEGAEINGDRAHWAQQLFPDELLSPIAQYDARLSKLTFSVMKSHTSWYKVDMNYAEPMEYSKPAPDLACDIPKKPCFEILNSLRSPPGAKAVMPFCYPDNYPTSDVAASLCARDQKTRFYCADFDGCPHLVTAAFIKDPYDHPDCGKATSIIDPSKPPPYIFGGTIGKSSICITVTSHNVGYPDPFKFALCVEHECIKTRRSIQLKFHPEDMDMDCFVECQESQSNQIATFTACWRTSGDYSIICPDYQQLCEPPPKTTTTPAPPAPKTTSPTAPEPTKPSKSTPPTAAPDHTPGKPEPTDDQPQPTTSVSVRDSGCVGLVGLALILAFSACT